MTRVAETIAGAHADGHAALIVYLPAGFPDMDTSLACTVAAAESGADLLEIGFPYSDPLMDGPTIQRATQVALDAGYTPDDDLALCGKLTSTTATPALVMTYYNLVWHYGGPDRLEAFATAAANAGVSGVILPDLPVDEGGPWRAIATRAGLATVFLVASTSTDDHLAAAAGASDGFIYATSTLGVTGARTAVSPRAQQLVRRLRAMTDRAVCVGIGVSTADQAAQVARFADGVIVGSAAVRAVHDGGPEAVGRLVRGLADGCRRGYESSARRAADSAR